MFSLVWFCVLLFSETLSSSLRIFAVEFERTNGLVKKHFAVGENAVLSCDSVDENHNFHFWHHVGPNNIIGPNQDYLNDYKYEYEVLSGNLTIRNLNAHDEGLYNCVSKGVRTDSTKITSVEISVSGNHEHSQGEVNSLKIILAICSLILFCSFIYAAYSVWKDRYVYPRYLEQFDEEDAEDNGEEIYRAPSTSGIIKQSIVKETPKNKSPQKDYERPLISTDFESILDSRI